MLPPGHIAAGFLTAKALLYFSHTGLSQPQQNQLLWWGAFFGFAPDLDTFYWFGKSKAFKIDPDQQNHRFFFTHAPVLWLIVGLAIYLIAGSPFWKTFGLLVWLCSWVHFLLDSIQYGVMWLWPAKKKVYCLLPVIEAEPVDGKIKEALKKNFFSYWITYIKEYSKGLIITLICEFILVISTIIIFFLSTKH